MQQKTEIGLGVKVKVLSLTRRGKTRHGVIVAIDYTHTYPYLVCFGDPNADILDEEPFALEHLQVYRGGRIPWGSKE